MRTRAAEAVVFLASAAVLVIEITAVRLMAPYVGQTLETFTAIISTVLAGIAAGTAIGGRLADVRNPHQLIRMELIAGGLLTIVLVPLVRLVGPAMDDGLVGLVVLTAFTVLAPAAVLSAISPAVVKATLSRLAETGATVGRFSAIGTAGAIAGSVITGFVLLSRWPTSSILITLGAGLTLLGVVLALRSDRRPALLAIPIVLLVGAGAAAADDPCDTETKYYCVQFLDDPPTGTYLILDDLFHSHVDAADPTHLEFSYTRMFGIVIDATLDGPVDAVHVGGGGFTMPRWLEATRPGSSSLVLEVDPKIVEIAQDRLGLVLGNGIEVDVGDARRSILEIPTDSADLVLGDAFGGRAVPWHLTTLEFHAQVDRILTNDGFYIANLIDGPDMDFVRSMTKTIGEIWPHVVVVAVEDRLEIGGNIVVAASQVPFDLEAIVDLGALRELRLNPLGDDDARTFAAGGVLLTDDFAPVDQLLSVR